MNVVTKTILKYLCVLAYFYFALYTFNHVNAWIGIGIAISGVLIIINFFSNKLSK